MSANDNVTSSSSTVLIIEPFYGGSHRQMTDLLSSGIEGVQVFTLPAKKWPWRCRCSALHFARTVPRNHNFRVLFASSVLNVAELIAMRPDLSTLKKIVYFHENQLAYPVQWWKERDFQYGYNQIVTCLVADEVVFNSSYNCQSFLSAIDVFFRMMPDHRPKGVAEELRPKCRVLYFPIDIVALRLLSDDSKSAKDRAAAAADAAIDVADAKPLHILWPHRWEFDKDPDSFFDVLIALADDNVPFKLSVLGEKYEDVPPIFEQARIRLLDKIAHWGFCTEKKSYVEVLYAADIVVSTAKHEFFGVAMLEAVALGCYPLCPDRLVYPEIFPTECLYNTSNQLRKRLKRLCQAPQLVRAGNLQVDVSKFSWQTLKKDYMRLLELESNACDSVEVPRHMAASEMSSN